MKFYLHGVPQGSILGPLLFLLFINDLPEKISSHIRLYADDVIIYRAVYSNNDVLRLQEDLNVLSKWASDRHMTFNLNKCEHLVVSNICSPLNCILSIELMTTVFTKCLLLNILGS